jgi:hypothetical protein
MGSATMLRNERPIEHLFIILLLLLFTVVCRYEAQMLRVLMRRSVSLRVARLANNSSGIFVAIWCGQLVLA